MADHDSRSSDIPIQRPGREEISDDILLVLTLDIPGIRSTKRALKVFDNLGYPREKTRVVVNRWSKNIDVELQ